MGVDESPEGQQQDGLRKVELVTTAEAAKYLGINRTTLARYAREGILKPTLRLPTGHLRWNLDDIRRQLDDLREQGKQLD